LRKKKEVAFEKAPQNFFETFTREFATSPGEQKSFCGAFFKKRPLSFWKQSETMIDWQRRGAAAMTGSVKPC
jgi:hypothetical protein